MRLLLDLPSGWARQASGDDAPVRIDDAVELTISPLLPLPEDVWEWAQGAPRRDLPAPATSATVGATSERRTTLGWPMTVLDSVALAADGAVVAARLHAVFPLLEHGAIVTVTAREPARLAARREEILGALSTARPDWGDQPGAALADLLRA